MSAVVVAGVRPYIVRQGDYVAKIAAQVGCGEDEIWKLPQNDPLRETDRSPEVLYPGDVLYVPERSRGDATVVLASDNPIQGVVPRVSLRLVFEIGDEPRARQKYRVIGLDEEVEGETGADGSILIHVPVVVRHVRVVFDDPPTTYVVEVGHADPVTESSGVIGRLRQLGYLDANERAIAPFPEEIRAAVVRFQRDQGLPSEGTLDEATLERLKKEARRG